MQLGIYLTTLSSPAIKRNVKLKQRTHLCYNSPFVTILPEALAPAFAFVNPIWLTARHTATSLL